MACEKWLFLPYFLYSMLPINPGYFYHFDNSSQLYRLLGQENSELVPSLTTQSLAGLH